jgi:sulfoquinovosidase
MTSTRLLALLALVLAACHGAPDLRNRAELGDFAVDLVEGALTITRADGTVLLESRPRAGVAWRFAEPTIKSAFGMFLFSEDAPPWSETSPASIVSADPRRVVLRAGSATGVLEVVGSGVLRVTWTLDEGAAANRLLQSFRCQATDRFYGLGALVHGTEHRGEVVPAWVTEQGIGKVRRDDTAFGFPMVGDVHDSYLPVPFVLTSRGFGLLVEDGRRSVFHLCPKDAADRWGVELWDRRLQLLLIDGPRLTDVIERLTAITGRPRLPPAWAFAPWIDAIRGQTHVQQVAEQLRKERIPSSAIWTEDWIGGEDRLGGYHLNYQWTADRGLYPQLPLLAGQLHARGFRFLGYFNPFIEDGTSQWTEALTGGYAVVGAEGRPLTFTGPMLQQTRLPDLSRPEAVAWMQTYFQQAEALGFDGWMADFGEWLPVDARLADGRTGLEAHNLYPLQWQQANRAFWDRRRPDGDYLFFVRSGWAGSGGLAPIFWAGDQQTEFGGLDGIASVVPIMVNTGMSGIPIMTHDIAGYSTFNTVGVTLPTTRELFFRWTELGALSPIMRTHHGAVAEQNWQWSRDAETIAHFRRYARLHVALFPYRYALAQQAVDRGLPMVRHLALHHERDPEVARVSDQFLLGPYLLVAPVLAEGATTRQVYLPRGDWYDYRTGVAHRGGATITVAAPLTEVPVFAPAGAIIPTLLADVDTLDRCADPAVKDLAAAEAGGLALQVFLGADGVFTLQDGTRLTLLSAERPPTAPPLTLDGASLPSCGAPPCVRGATAVLDGSTSFALRGMDGARTLFTLQVSGAPRARRYEVTVVR